MGGPLASITYDDEGNAVEIQHLNWDKLPNLATGGSQAIKYSLKKRKPTMKAEKTEAEDSSKGKKSTETE